MQEKRAGQLSYIPEFDSLRALAVFAVLIDHYGGGIFSVIGNAVPLGLFGVHLFFVLSGFLITSILLDQRERLGSDGGNLTLSQALTAFFSRRFLRIMPAYYLLLFLELFWGDPAFRDVMGWHFVYLSNTVSAVFYDASATGGLIHASSAHLWSLSVEAQFYLFWPFAVLLLNRRLLVTLTLALIALAPLSRAFFFGLGYQFDVGYLISTTDTLCAGALLAMWRSGWLPWLTRGMISRLTFTAAAIFAACTAASIQGLWYRPTVIVYPLVESMLFVWLLLSLIEGRLTPLAQTLRSNWLIYLGKISYGIYLYHAFVWDTVKEHIIDLTPSLPFVQSLIAIAATVAFASASWWALERHLLRIGRRKRATP